jgi:hypothetical protein
MLRRMTTKTTTPSAPKHTSGLTRKDYADAVAKMNAMVKSGEITSEQMQQRLEAMRSKGPQGGRKFKEISDDCMALRRRIRAAMGEGAIASKEAKKIWEAEGCP